MTEGEQWWGVLGANRRQGGGLGQEPIKQVVPGSAAAHTFIRDALEQDLPPALEKGMDALGERLSPWPTIVVAAVIVTAVGVSILAIKALTD